MILICPVCKTGIADHEGFVYGSVSSTPYRMFRVHATPNNAPGSSPLTCVDRLVDAANAGTLSLNGASDSRASVVALALDAIKENPSQAERILTLAERALS